MTAQELQKQLVVWAKEQASHYGIQASIASRKKTIHEMHIRSLTYSFIAQHIEGLELEKITPRKPKMCPDTQRPCEENCSQVDCHLKLSKAGLFDLE